MTYQVTINGQNYRAFVIGKYLEQEMTPDRLNTIITLVNSWVKLDFAPWVFSTNYEKRELHLHINNYCFKEFEQEGFLSGLASYCIVSPVSLDHCGSRGRIGEAFLQVIPIVPSAESKEST